MALTATDLDLISAGLSLISAILWASTAFVDTAYSWDNDPSAAYRRVAILNSAGAVFIALAAFAQAWKAWPGV
jgi:hypothetical protein